MHIIIDFILTITQFTELYYYEYTLSILLLIYLRASLDSISIAVMQYIISRVDTQ
jgi:hypothetical protein